jgi:hypothetical protein
MPLAIHKAFIKSTLKKDTGEKPTKKKRRITIYNKFMRIAMPAVRGKYPGEKQGFYMQMVGTMWRLLPVEQKKSFANMKIV